MIATIAACLVPLATGLLPLQAAGPNLLPETEWGVIRPDEAALKVEKASLSTPVGGATTSLKITVNRATDPFYHLQVAKDVPTPIADGTRLRLSFWARSRTANPIRATVEKVGPPWTASSEIRVTLTPEWRAYQATGVSAAYPANGMGVRIQFGHQVGELEVAAVRLESLGMDPALRNARAAIEPAAVEECIRRNRTGTLKVIVRDASGKAVPGATVRVRQTRHAFLFGCNIFALNPDDASPLQRLYQERFKAVFNFATLPFYWGSYEPQRGAQQHERLTAMARWCVDNGLTAKGHPLIWHEVYPRWAPSDPDTVIPMLEARVRDLIPRYRGLVTVWDVLNEANNAPDYAQTGVGAWIKRDGGPTVVARALRWAREAANTGAGAAGAKPQLLYNDFNTSEANVQLLEGLRERKSLPDAIGIQSHMHGGVWPLEHLWGTLERFAVFGKPLHFTEATVVSGNKPSDPAGRWETTPEGERAQAEYVERFYSILFSHPAVEAVTWWDFSDLNAWQGAPAGFLRKDMSPKPAYDRLAALIKTKWWTNARSSTDAAGSCTTRAFQGSHEIEVTDARGRRATVKAELPMGRKSVTVAVTLR
jgi:GH35 family endo-1,4-beta-xylanase